MTLFNKGYYLLRKHLILYQKYKYPAKIRPGPSAGGANCQKAQGDTGSNILIDIVHFCIFIYLLGSTVREIEKPSSTDSVSSESKLLRL